MPNVGFGDLKVPGITGGFGLGTAPEPVRVGRTYAAFSSKDFDGKSIEFRFPYGECRWYPPEPIVQEVDLMGAISLTQFMGQKPYRAEIDVRLDGFPVTSVEEDIKTLEHFAEVHAGRSEPPIFEVKGDVPLPHPGLKWRVTGFSQPQIEYVVGSPKERARYFTTVTLSQYVTDRVLVESLKKTSKSKGMKTRTEVVREGEEWLFEVARRVYKDPSRAGDLATANGLHLGKKLTPGTRLRVP